MTSRRTGALSDTVARLRSAVMTIPILWPVIESATSRRESWERVARVSLDTGRRIFVLLSQGQVGSTRPAPRTRQPGILQRKKSMRSRRKVPSIHPAITGSFAAHAPVTAVKSRNPGTRQYGPGCPAAQTKTAEDFSAWQDGQNDCLHIKLQGETRAKHEPLRIQ